MNGIAITINITFKIIGVAVPMVSCITNSNVACRPVNFGYVIKVNIVSKNVLIAFATVGCNNISEFGAVGNFINTIGVCIFRFGFGFTVPSIEGYFGGFALFNFGFGSPKC